MGRHHECPCNACEAYFEAQAQWMDIASDKELKNLVELGTAIQVGHASANPPLQHRRKRDGNHNPALRAVKRRRVTRPRTPQTVASHAETPKTIVSRSGTPHTIASRSETGESASTTLIKL